MEHLVPPSYQNFTLEYSSAFDGTLYFIIKLCVLHGKRAEFLEIKAGSTYGGAEV
jgi:hypothetical protein